MGVLDAKPAELEAILSRQAASIDPDLAGPFKILSVAPSGKEAVRCEVTACRLVPVDAGDPAPDDIVVPVPASGWIELRADGTVAVSSVSRPGPEEVREAQVFARDLVAQGAVGGLPGGPGGRPRGRPTHELQTDAQGRRIIRRIGYTIR